MQNQTIHSQRRPDRVGLTIAGGKTGCGNAIKMSALSVTVPAASPRHGARWGNWPAVNFLLLPAARTVTRSERHEAGYCYAPGAKRLLSRCIRTGSRCNSDQGALLFSCIPADTWLVGSRRPSPIPPHRGGPPQVLTQGKCDEEVFAPSVWSIPVSRLRILGIQWNRVLRLWLSGIRQLAHSRRWRANAQCQLLRVPEYTLWRPLKMVARWGVGSVPRTLGPP